MYSNAMVDHTADDDVDEKSAIDDENSGSVIYFSRTRIYVVHRFGAV